jgi:hypothetical protein
MHKFRGRPPNHPIARGAGKRGFAFLPQAYSTYRELPNAPVEGELNSPYHLLYKRSSGVGRLASVVAILAIVIAIVIDFDGRSEEGVGAAGVVKGPDDLAFVVDRVDIGR